MDFEYAKDVGYYFDRCIDLTFYDTDMEFIACLKTPAHGMKPTITIKGLFIEGGYAIDSYISIQNMAFDVDIAYVGFIKARMYYSGIEETVVPTRANLKMKGGHTILYRVLYADQEKEPPQRCVRFQCVVASKDTSMYNTPMYVSGGSANYKRAGTDTKNLVKEIKDKKSSKVPLKKLCEELINIYNEGILKNTKAGTNTELFNLLRISLLEIDAPLEKIEVPLSSGEYTIGDFIRQLNCKISETKTNGFSYSKFKIVVDRGTMRVSTPVPTDWKEIARKEGYSEANFDEYYEKTYLNVKTNTYTFFGSSPTGEKSSVVVPLNFVKSATRSESVIYVETLFDDRITPGCHVAIKSNAIMGKKFGSSKSTKGGSRLIHYLDKDKPVVFRNTGKIEYLFSTTEGSYMKLQGPVDESVDAKEWSKKRTSIYE